MFLTLAAALAQTPPIVRTELPDHSVVLGGTSFRHNATVDAAAFSPDDKSVWTLADEKLTQWTVETGVKVKELRIPCPDASGTALAVSPANDALAVGCSENILLVDLDGKVQSVLALPESEQLVWGDRVLGVYANEKVTLWSLKKNKELASFPSSWAPTMDTSQGRWALAGLTASNDRTKMVVVDAKMREVWSKVGDSIEAARFSMDGTKVAVANSNLNIYDADKGEELAYVELEFFGRRLTTTPEGWLIGDYETLVGVLDDGKTGSTFNVATDSFVGSPMGTWMMDPDGARLRLFDNSLPKPHLPGEGLANVADAVSAGDDLIAAYTDTETAIILPSTGQHLSVDLIGPEAGAARPDGKMAAFAGDGVVLVTRDGTTRKVSGVEELSGYDMLHFSPDGGTLWAVSSSYEETLLTRIDVAKAQLVETRTLADHIGNVVSADAAGTHLYLVQPDGRIRMIPLTDPKKAGATP